LAFLIDYGFSVDLRNRKGELLLEEVLEDIEKFNTLTYISTPFYSFSHVKVLARRQSVSLRALSSSSLSPNPLGSMPFSGTTLGEDLLCDQEILLASNENLFQSFEERASGISHAGVTSASGKEDELSHSWDLDAEEFLSTELGSNAGDAGFVTETGPKGLSALSSHEDSTCNYGEVIFVKAGPLVQDVIALLPCDGVKWKCRG
jgi:hypothetical protein